MNKTYISSILTQSIPAIVAGFILFASMSCTTTADNIVLTTDLQEVKAKINRIDLMLLDLRFKPDPLLFAQVRTLIKEQLSMKIPDKSLEAELYGLLGLADYFQGIKENRLYNLDSIESRSKKEARLYLLTAFGENDLKKKQDTLEKGIKTSSEPGLLKLELAGLLFSKGEYAKSAALYDEVFPELDPKYKEYYFRDRNKAFELKSNPPERAGIRLILEKDALTVSDVLTITLTETNLLDHVTSNKPSNADNLLVSLKKNGSVYSQSIGSHDMMTRKDIAYFILSIVVYLENNKALATKQSYEYSRLNRESPVPDVKVSDYFFDAVIVLVERETVDLPDGINFYPDRPMSGSEYYEILLKLKKH